MRIEPLVVRAEAIQCAWLTLLGARGGRLRRVPKGLEREKCISSPATGTRLTVSGACGARAVQGRSATVEESWYLF